MKYELSDDLNISLLKAKYYVFNLMNTMHKKYNIEIITKNETKSNVFGYVRNGIVGDFSIFINMETNNRLFDKVDDIFFLNCICTLYHAQQHIKQTCYLYYENSDDAVNMAMSQFAYDRNNNYYVRRYKNDLSEIDAEYIALIDTKEYLENKFPYVNSDKLMCKLVNYKMEANNYPLHGEDEFKTFNDVINAFDKHYEEAKQATIDYNVMSFDKNDDECIRFLQIYMFNKDVRPIINKFDSVNNAIEKDILIASITHHLHPEIDYERIYPCLKGIDLSPEKIFSKS